MTAHPADLKNERVNHMAKTSTVTIPQKLTASGSPEASQGVSMTEMIQQAIAAMIASGSLGGLSPAVPSTSAVASPVASIPQVVAGPTATVPKASSKSSKKAPAGSGPAVNAGLSGSGKLGKLGSVVTPKAGPVVDSDDAERFDARRYFSLNPQMDLVRLDDQTFIGRSTDEKYAKNPIAIVGVQRKTMMLSEAKCMVLFEMLKAVCE